MLEIIQKCHEASMPKPLKLAWKACHRSTMNPNIPHVHDTVLSDQQNYGQSPFSPGKSINFWSSVGLGALCLFPWPQNSEPRSQPRTGIGGSIRYAPGHPNVTWPWSSVTSASAASLGTIEVSDYDHQGTTTPIKRPYSLFIRGWHYNFCGKKAVINSYVLWTGSPPGKPTTWKCSSSFGYTINIPMVIRVMYPNLRAL